MKRISSTNHYFGYYFVFLGLAFLLGINGNNNLLSVLLPCLISIFIGLLFLFIFKKPKNPNINSKNALFKYIMGFFITFLILFIHLLAFHLTNDFYFPNFSLLFLETTSILTGSGATSFRELSEPLVLSHAALSLVIRVFTLLYFVNFFFTRFYPSLFLEKEAGKVYFKVRKAAWYYLLFLAFLFLISLLLLLANNQSIYSSLSIGISLISGTSFTPNQGFLMLDLVNGPSRDGIILLLSFISFLSSCGLFFFLFSGFSNIKKTFKSSIPLIILLFYVLYFLVYFLNTYLTRNRFGIVETAQYFFLVSGSPFIVKEVTNIPVYILFVVISLVLFASPLSLKNSLRGDISLNISQSLIHLMKRKKAGEKDLYRHYYLGYLTDHKPLSLKEYSSLLIVYIPFIFLLVLIGLIIPSIDGFNSVSATILMFFNYGSNVIDYALLNVGDGLHNAWAIHLTLISLLSSLSLVVFPYLLSTKKSTDSPLV